MVRRSHHLARVQCKADVNIWICFRFSSWQNISLAALGTVSNALDCTASPFTWIPASQRMRRMCTKAMNRTTFEWIMVDGAMWSENDVYKWMHKKAIRDSHVRCAERKYANCKIFHFFIIFLGDLHSCNQVARASWFARLDEVNNDMKLRSEKSFCSFLGETI